MTMTVTSGSELLMQLTTSNDDDNNDNSISMGDDTSSAGSAGLRLKNVRIVVEAGGKLTVGMMMMTEGLRQRPPGQGSSSSLMLEGAAQQVGHTNVCTYLRT